MLRALAMLTWVASVLAGRWPRQRHLRQRGDVTIDRLALLVKKLIVVRAGDFARLKRNGRVLYFKHGRDLRRANLVRSVIGSQLRRALDDRDPSKRVATLIEALTHLDAWAARFAKRLRCGFKRIWSIAPKPMPAAVIFGPPASAPGCADSS